MARGPRLAVAAVALLLAAAGVAALVGLVSTDERTSRDPLAGVPADVDYVGHLDADAYRTDPSVAGATRYALRFQSAVDFYDGPAFARSHAVRETGSSDPTAVRSVTYFGRHGSAYRARIVVGNWTAEEVKTAVEADGNVSLDPTTANGSTVFRGGGLAVARLGNASAGTVLAVGNASAVRDALAVERGNASGVAGPLRSKFEGTSGYVRFAYRFRPGTVPEYPFVGDAVRSVRYVAASYRLNRSATGTPDETPPATAGTETATGDASETTPDVEVVVEVTAEDADSARSVRSILNAGATFYRVETGNETLRRELARVELSPATERTVTLRYESSPEGLRVLVRGLYRNQPEPGGGGGS